MSAFFIGQRVRVNCPGSKVHGEESIILRLGIQGGDFGVTFIGHEVDIPCGGCFPFCIFYPHELEPILPSGHTAGHEGVCEELDKLLAGEVA